MYIPTVFFLLPVFILVVQLLTGDETWLAHLIRMMDGDNSK